MGENVTIIKNRAGGTVRLAEMAAEKIRKMIIENMFEAGEPLSEMRLAEMLNVSRTPIREAIAILEQEGLLSTVHGKGAFISEQKRSDFKEINDLRMVLEPLAAVSALYTIPPPQLAEHMKVWDRFLSEFESGLELSVTELSEKDDSLHFMYINSCGNKRLQGFLRVLRFQTNCYVYAHWNTRESIGETIRQHIEIINAIQNRDEVALSEAIKAHIEYNNRFIGIYMQ
ncbi:MAG: GntR family transcriptional regulator [Clostridia bacterium]|nr:GntR family transcriptional regulator [Clostridia bacterium]